MILKAISQICKSYKSLRIVDGNKQWIGVPEAIYSANGLPAGLSKAEVCSIFDIPEEKQEKMFIEQLLPAMLPVPIADGINNDAGIKKAELKVSFSNEIYEVLYTSLGIRLLNVRFLKPLSDDIKEGFVNYYERISSNGEIYACISDGFSIGAVIRLDVPTEIMRNEMAVMYQAVAATLYEEDEADPDEEDDEEEAE